ncbi:MAG: hypothetical protein A2X86_00940 [Bdellovibrionales bacterium GWA2_49_15]|nr:MAG: hypothetical protein A2X86_00940 [Bdellovibrionales bacterium GWA2_49_15]HAZ11763.1 hypothetical protein [Bdellovibrionales bacterium]
MKHSWPLFLFYFLIKLALEIFLLMRLHDFRLFFLHLGFSPFLFLILQRMPFSMPLKMAVFVFDLLFPVIGQLGGILFLILLYFVRPLYTKKGKELFELPHGDRDYNRYMVEKKIINKTLDNLGEEETYLKFVHVDSVVDVMRGEDKTRKIRSIQEIARMNPKDFIPQLQHALQDEVYEVRYMAKHILEGMEKKIMDELEAMHAQLQLHPTDYQVHNSMARAYISAARSGIFDQVLARNFLNKAFDSLHVSLQIFPDQKALYVRILEIYIHLEEYQKCADLGPSVLTMPMPSEEWCKLAFYYAEALFHLQDYELLKEICDKILDKKPKYDKIKDTVRFWSRLSHDAV